MGTAPSTGAVLVVYALVWGKRQGAFGHAGARADARRPGPGTGALGGVARSPPPRGHGRRAGDRGRGRCAGAVRRIGPVGATTSLSLCTNDWDATCRYTGVWPVGTVLAGAARPIVAQGMTAHWPTKTGLWRPSVGGSGQRVAHRPPSRPTGATLTGAAGSTGLALAGRGGRRTWSTAADCWAATP